MDKQIVDFVAEKTRALMDAPSCCQEAKAAAQAWLDAVGTAKEAEATAAYIAELERDIMPVDMLIQFAESEQGIQIFGSDRAKAIADHGRELKAKGAVYCDCPACTAAAAILEKKSLLIQ